MTIGERIKQLRTDLGITQEELAQSVGYSSRSTINKIEAGDRKINQDTITLFAKALNVSPAYLMGWEDEEQESANESEIEYINKLMSDFTTEEFSEVKDYILFLKSKKKQQ